MVLPNVGTNVPKPTAPTGTAPASATGTPPAPTPPAPTPPATPQKQVQASQQAPPGGDGCAPGMEWDPVTQQCINPNQACGEGKKLVNGVCVPDTGDGEEPCASLGTGYYWDDVLHKCVRTTGFNTSDPFKQAPPGALSALQLLLGITPRPIAGMNPWLDEVGKHIMTLPNLGARGQEAYDLAGSRARMDTVTGPELLALQEAQQLKSAGNLDNMMNQAWKGFNKREAESIKNRASLYGTAGSGSTDAALNESFRDAYALPLMRESADRTMRAGEYTGNMLQALGGNAYNRQYQNQSDYMNMLRQMEQEEKGLTKDAMELGWRQGEKVQGTEQAGYDAYMDEINRLRGYSENALGGMLGTLPSSIGSTTSGGGK